MAKMAKFPLKDTTLVDLVVDALDDAGISVEDITPLKWRSIITFRGGYIECHHQEHLVRTWKDGRYDLDDTFQIERDKLIAKVCVAEPGADLSRIVQAAKDVERGRV